MRLHFIGNRSEGDTKEQILAFAKEFELCEAKDADVLYCATIAAMNQALSLKVSTGKFLAVYCWDYYLWAHNTSNHSGDWRRYAELLKLADIVFVPSEGQQRRLKEILNLDSDVVHTGINVYDHEAKDEGYILDPVRHYPEENHNWAERAARELGIPFVHSEHRLSLDEFRKAVSNCTFMTCAYREASTGGLTLMEGLWNGKPSLVSDSPYMGARDYLGNFGHYFRHDDYGDLKAKMLQMWTERPRHDIISARKHVGFYSFERMAGKIRQRICALYKN